MGYLTLDYAYQFAESKRLIGPPISTNEEAQSQGFIAPAYPTQNDTSHHLDEVAP